MVITLCYDAVSRNVEGMGISPFIMFSLSALAVLPSSVLLVLLQDRIGRKGMASGSLLVGGLFTAAAGIAIAYQQHNHNAILLACLTIAARFGVAISYESGSQYATELIPTCVRGQGVAAVHVAGFAASFLAPYILWLGTFFKAAPSIILGVLFFAGSFVCLTGSATRRTRHVLASLCSLLAPWWAHFSTVCFPIRLAVFPPSSCPTSAALPATSLPFSPRAWPLSPSAVLFPAWQRTQTST